MTTYVFGVIVVLFLMSLGIAKLIKTNKATQQKLIDVQLIIDERENLYAQLLMQEPIRANLKNTLEEAPLALILADDKKIIWLNHYAEVRLGASYGSDISLLFDDPDAYEQYVFGTKDSGQVENLKLENGELNRFQIILTTAFQDNKALTALWCIDVEPQEAQKDSIQRLRQDLQKVLSTLPSAMIIVNAEDYNIMYANNLALKILNLNDDDIDKGLNLIRLFYHTQPNSVSSETLLKEKFGEVMANGNAVWEWQHTLLNNLPLDVRVSGIRTSHGKMNAVALTLVDLWDEKFESSLVNMLAQHEKDANQLKNAFLINVSHEIRTPMNAILGLSELELLNEHSKEHYEAYRKINISAKNLLTIISDILDFSKIEASRLEIKEEEFFLEDVVSNSLLMASQRIGSKNIEMNVNYDLRVSNKVISDPTRLWQILKNLLDNAAKYTREGTITLDVELLESNIEQSTQQIRFSIIDTGYGMTPEQIDAVFVPFSQFHNQAEGRIMGTGLGMSITKQICELLDGNIDIESTINVGTKIIVTIPFKLPQSYTPLKLDFTVVDLSRHHVLVIEPEPIARKTFGDLLHSVSAKVTLTQNIAEAKAAIEIASRKGFSYKKAICDYSLIHDFAEIAQSQMQTYISSMKSRQSVLSESTPYNICNVLEKPICPSGFFDTVFEEFAATESIANKQRFTFSGVHVLLCEDNEVNQEVARGLLKRLGITPTIVSNGRDGLHWLGKKKFDIILMDIIMPELDGIETTKIIRRSQNVNTNIPILAFTANIMPTDIERYLAAGINGYIEKPVTLDTMYKMLLQYLPENTKRVVFDANIVANAAATLEKFNNDKVLYHDELMNFIDRIPNNFMRFSDALRNFDETAKLIEMLKISSDSLNIDNIYQCINDFESTVNQLRSEYHELVAHSTQVKKDSTLYFKKLNSTHGEYQGGNL